MAEIKLIYKNEFNVDEFGDCFWDDELIKAEVLAESLENLQELAIRIQDPNVLIGRKQLDWLLQQKALVEIQFTIGAFDVITLRGTIQLIDMAIPNRKWVREENDGFWFKRVPSSRG